MDTFEKQQRIQKIAQEDMSYQAWHQTFLEYEHAFEVFASKQSEEIQDILWGYAAGGRMMNQRLLNLACEHMIFPK